MDEEAIYEINKLAKTEKKSEGKITGRKSVSKLEIIKAVKTTTRSPDKT